MLNVATETEVRIDQSGTSGSETCYEAPQVWRAWFDQCSNYPGMLCCVFGEAFMSLCVLCLVSWYNQSGKIIDSTEFL